MSTAAAAATQIDRDVLKDMYRTMVLVRKVELQLAKSYQQGLVHGACHTYVGQEAIAAGVCAHLRVEDAVFSTHRGHGHALAKGVPARQLVAELYGRNTGCSEGRGGSMHLFAPEVGMMGTSGIVGPCILQAVGAGYSFQLLNTDQVAVAFFGDGAVNNGAFHEGLNLAGIWKLPVVLVCENNGFATEVAFRDASASPQVAARGQHYGLPGVEVDGNDALAVYAAAAEAIERARRGDGATLLECKTYRTRAHAEGMVDFTYRTREEVDAWKARCPLALVRSVLVQQHRIDEAELAALEREVDQLVREAHDFALGSDFPAPESATTHVFATPREEDPDRAADRAAGFAWRGSDGVGRRRRRDPNDQLRGRHPRERSPTRCSGILQFSSWAKESASGGAISIRPPGCSPVTDPGGSATRRFANADSSA